MIAVVGIILPALIVFWRMPPWIIVLQSQDSQHPVNILHPYRFAPCCMHDENNMIKENTSFIETAHTCWASLTARSGTPQAVKHDQMGLQCGEKQFTKPRNMLRLCLRFEIRQLALPHEQVKQQHGRLSSARRRQQAVCQHALQGRGSGTTSVKSQIK
jgi:hypothetical protein